MTTKTTKTKTDDPFGSADNKAPQVSLKDYSGVLIILQPTEDPITVDTQYGEAEATPCRLLNVENDADGWVDLLVFQKGVQAQLRANDGKPVPGVLSREKTAKPGKSPAYVLEVPNAAQSKAARAAWDKHQDASPF